MPKKVIIVRHGEREDHIRPAWRDTAEHISNSPLSSDGLLQARAVGEHLKKTEKVTKIYTSPFTRTLQTGNEIAEVLDLPMHVEHGICEWLCDEWFEGPYYWPPLEEAKASFPRIREEYKPLLHPVYPESRPEVRIRCAKSGKAIVDQHYVDGVSDDSTILLVCHGKIVEDLVIGLTGGDDIPYVTYCSASHVLRNGLPASTEFSRGVMVDTSFIPESIRPTGRVKVYS